MSSYPIDCLLNMFILVRFYFFSFSSDHLLLVKVGSIWELRGHKRGSSRAIDPVYWGFWFFYICISFPSSHFVKKL